MGIVQNKVAIITGAGSGLGKAAALGFAREGAIVVLCGRRMHKIAEVERQITEAGGRALAVRTDVSDEAEVSRLIGTVLDRFGTVDILLNNAAVCELASLTETSLQSWEYQFSVNVTGPFLMMKACLPIMRKHNYGRIVNITSGLSHNGARGYAAYGASKAALESLTRAAADEEESYDILINMYNPGMIRSEMHATGKDPEVVVPDLLHLVSLPRKGLSGRLLEAAR